MITTLRFDESVSACHASAAIVFKPSSAHARADIVAAGWRHRIGGTRGAFRQTAPVLVCETCNTGAGQLVSSCSAFNADVTSWA